MSRHPEWLQVRVRVSPEAARSAKVIAALGVDTVCRSARCPNSYDCLGRGTATFMVLGTTCTRDCRFCAVPAGSPGPVDPGEPDRIAEAAARLGLTHVVVTSVTRDDLGDGGASHFAAVLRAVRRRLAQATTEVLVPDLGGDEGALEALLQSPPDVFGHNVETVPRLYRSVRPGADYERSLALLCEARRRGGMRTKSGLMLGMGETRDEVLAAMTDLRQVNCDLLTVGQYLPPSRAHFAAARFVPPEEFTEVAAVARDLGFAAVAAGPLVRSSYRAAEALAEAGGARSTIQASVLLT